MHGHTNWQVSKCSTKVCHKGHKEKSNGHPYTKCSVKMQEPLTQMYNELDEMENSPQQILEESIKSQNARPLLSLNTRSSHTTSSNNKKDSAE